ncbi:MAG TPA: alkaline phosphatase family protein [Phycisphaerales bacterium]|nr:alkaline phosphatase family protein [Phycisphaerales bacterium]
MPHKTVVIDVVGLTESRIGAHMPRLKAFAESGMLTHLTPPLPAVTTTSQSAMLTGVPVHEHGIVGNGWYDRESAEVRFWKQSNRLVHAEKVWETARRRDPSVTCAQMFWWYNMYSSADWSVTPRPIYKADGRKIPDCYSEPSELRDRLQADLGAFPLFRFWGPAASIESSRWIAEASIRVDRAHDPTLSLIYLPHLDYALQKFGPASEEARAADTEIDAVVGSLLDHFQSRGARVLIVSEYGVEPVSEAVHINRVLRGEGLVRVREEEGLELLDAGASRAFAVADHQVAHVYVRDAADLPAVKALCERTEGVDLVLDDEGKRGCAIDHERAGDLVLVSRPGRWFSYCYWLDDARAPDFARTVDIHRKPGYDPCELFIDPAIRFPKLKIAATLLKKKLGFRALMDVIPLDTSLVRGSHGRPAGSPADGPVLIGDRGRSPGGVMPMEGVRDVILESLFSGD